MPSVWPPPGDVNTSRRAQAHTSVDVRIKSTHREKEEVDGATERGREGF